MSTETVGLLGMGAQDGHLDFHTAPELCYLKQNCNVIYKHIKPCLKNVELCTPAVFGSNKQTHWKHAPKTHAHKHTGYTWM